MKTRHLHLLGVFDLTHGEMEGKPTTKTNSEANLNQPKQTNETKYQNQHKPTPNIPKLTQSTPKPRKQNQTPKPPQPDSPTPKTLRFVTVSHLEGWP